jgi:hypothetical protein
MKTSLSPFGRRNGSKNDGSFTNGPNSKERSVWIGGTTAFVRQARAREEDGETRTLLREEDNVSSTNPSDSSRGLFSVSTGDNDSREKQQRQKKPSILKRIKALSPRRGGDNSGGKDDADDDGDDVFFSPASNPPSGEAEGAAAATTATSKNRKMKRQLSVSIGGETILGEEENTISSSSFSSSKNNRRTPRRGNDKTKRRNRRNSSGSSSSMSSSSYHSRQLFGSVTSVDIPSRALTLSSLDDTDENRDSKSSSRQQEEDVDLEAASVNSPTRQIQTPPQRVGSKRKNNVNHRRVSTPEAAHNALRHEEASNSATRVKRRRLSKRARTRLTMREVNTHIQVRRDLQLYTTTIHTQLTCLLFLSLADITPHSTRWVHWRRAKQSLYPRRLTSSSELR